MRYAQIRSMDISNGEGVGIALFVQGCHFHCKNCFNQDTWDFNGGKEWTKETKNEFLELIEKPYIKRVSFLGGECLADENLEGVYDLIKNIKKIVNYIIAVKGFDNAVPSVNVKLCILGTILCIAFIIPIIVLCTFKIYIPEGFIPEHDRICDISYYYDYMLNFVQGIRTED